MGLYRIEFTSPAYRAFARLDPQMQRRLAPHIDNLSANPRPAPAKRLNAEGELFRLRVGAYRVVYRIEDDVLLVLVVKLGHRRDVYRGL